MNDSTETPFSQEISDTGLLDDSINDATMLVLVSDDDQPVLQPMPTDYLSTRTIEVVGGRKYDVERIVAKGGMGIVYEARDIHCERVVALKVLLTGGRFEKENRQRFVSEAQITSKLEHPNIVPVHELGKDVGGNSFYTMKYVKGLTLGDILNEIRRGKQEFVDQYPLGRLLTIFQKTCDAVAFAHANGVVHRDLKPGNIMIGKYGEVLVLDWGLAKVLSGESRAGESAETDSVPVKITGDEVGDKARIEIAGRSLDTIHVDTSNAGLKTISGTVLGTPGFMAPEQVRNDSEIDERTDIYALGAILYSILTLNSPLKERNIPELLQKILNGEIAPPSSYNQKMEGQPAVTLAHCPEEQIPEVLSEISVKAMSVNPANRYQSVKEMQDEIEAYQNGFVWHVVVDDDFSSPKALEHWEPVGCSCEIVDGELRVFDGDLQMLLLKRDLPGDVRIEFECRLAGNYLNDLGCILSAMRSKSEWDTSVSGYAFKYGAYTNTLNVITRCDRRIWSEQASPLVVGRYFNVRVERVGGRLRMFVDGREVCTVTDPEPLTGANRTVVGLLGWVADKRFRRIRVSSLGTPWKSDILDVAERHLQRGHHVTAMDLFQDILNSFPDPQRVERACRGFDTARRRHEMEKTLPIWCEHLGKAWKGVPFQFNIENDGITLEIPDAGIEDLEPLRGIPLTSLSCWGNRIRSLEPLREAPLNFLNCAGNPIESLDPLRGLPLSVLRCEGCCIRSLAPLKGLPLTMLSCGQNRLEDGLSALTGMPLTWLSVIRCRIKSLEPLRGLPLNMLFIEGNEVEDISPLKGMPLTEISLAGNRVKDLEPLRGVPLNTLRCGDNQIENLEPLRGMLVSTLFCNNNRIRNLEPLRGMPLSALLCGGNLFKDIGPFIKNPPKHFLFDCDSMSAHDMEWLRDTWSRDFRLAEYVDNVEVSIALRNQDVPKLKSLASEFNGHRYLFIPRFLCWDEAEALCESLGGHLVTITSRGELDFIISMVSYGCSWFWIGLKTTGGQHEWVTGERFEFKAFSNVMQENGAGPWVFAGRSWRYEDVPAAHTCCIIEWDS